MASPFAEVDDIVVAQFREYAGLTAILPARMIQFEQRAVSAEQFFGAPQQRPAIRITPVDSSVDHYLSADTSNDPLVYEAAIAVPGKNHDTMRDIQWQIRRLLSHLGDFEDATGTTLSGVNPSPYKWGRIAIQSVTNAHTEDELRSVFRFVVPLLASEEDIQASASAPVAVSAVRATVNADLVGPFSTFFDIIIVSFDKRIAAIRYSEVDPEDQNFSGDMGDTPGDREWFGEMYYASGVDNKLIVGGVATTLQVPGPGVNQISYAADPANIIGANGVAVASFANLAVTQAS